MSYEDDQIADGLLYSPSAMSDEVLINLHEHIGDIMKLLPETGPVCAYSESFIDRSIFIAAASKAVIYLRERADDDQDIFTFVDDLEQHLGIPAIFGGVACGQVLASEARHSLREECI